MIKLLSVAIFATLFLESHQRIPIGPTDPVVKLVCWTDWFDRDNPSGSGDWELLKDLRKENPGKICEYPLHIKVVTTDTMTPAISTGQTFYIFNPTQGFVCRNKDQRKDMCRDYKIRFGCPCRLVEPCGVVGCP
ncbi:cartilage intermediate layer protein 1-like [Gymnodraco acuticeps]|uniref:Cartilage intermediate layer protein 1-like n=1 Tax=Gymnodraco acuticeps TaxID=8218 RepID=A0A6P8T521_GYMAC|nr:cartilage intermediate layer protein 1-like [Gymnodraco acuticeps]